MALLRAFRSRLSAEPPRARTVTGGGACRAASAPKWPTRKWRGSRLGALSFLESSDRVGKPREAKRVHQRPQHNSVVDYFIILYNEAFLDASGRADRISREY